MEIRLESPFPFEALPRVWRWIETFRGKVADDFSPSTEDEFVSQMCSKWFRISCADSHKSWAVYADDELGGLITFERLSPWLGPAHLVLKPDFQGKGIAVKACRVAVGEMFEQGIGKLAFYPLAGNVAIGSLIVNLGGRREGKLEAHTICGGKPTDIWVYGLKKEEFENARSTTAVYPGHHRGGLVDRRVVSVGKAQDQHAVGDVD